MSGRFEAFNFKQWIDEHRHLLKPPVGNKMIWKDRGFIVMVVGGPNERTDFHVNETEEFFYQVEGDMVLKVINDEGQIQDINIREGDIYLLPAEVPHSPQRFEGTVGLVVEKRRDEGEKDALQWHCEKCVTQLYKEEFVLTNIETQFPAVFERYYNSEHVKCPKCGHVNGRKWSA